MAFGTGQKQTVVEEFNILDLAAFLLRCWRWMALYVFLFAAVTIHHHRQNPSYTASGSLLLEGTRPNSFQAIADKFLGGGNLYESKEEQMERYVLILNSRFFLESVADHVMKSPNYEKFLQILELGSARSANYSRTQVADFIRSNISIDRYKSDFIRVESTNASPWKAVSLTNIGLDAVKGAIVERESSDANGGRQFFEGQIKEIQARIDAIDEEILSQKGTFGPDGISMGRQKAETQISNLAAQYLEKKVKLEEAQAQLRELEEQAANDPHSSTSIDKYSPEILASEKRRKVYLLKKEQDAYKRVIDRMEAENTEEPGTEHRLADLYKKKEMEYHLMNEFKRELSLTNIQVISVANRVKILEPAEMGSVATRNLIPDLVKRSILAILLAIATAFILENYNPVVRSRRDLQGMPMFFVGSIPRLERLDRKRFWSVFYGIFPFLERKGGRKDSNRNLELKPDSTVDLIFKNIRAHVIALGSRGERRPKVISVMSPMAGEGKTLLSNGLAKSLAFAGARVLLVDSDVRRRSLSVSWGYGKDAGFMDHLENPHTNFRGTLVRKVTPLLDVLPAGNYTPHCSELIASTHFSEAIEALSEFYDYIVIDTPPAVPYSEVFDIAQASDLVLFSFTVKETSIESVEKAMERIRFVDPTPAIGYVLNKHDSFNAYSYYSQPKKAPPAARIVRKGRAA